MEAGLGGQNKNRKVIFSLKRLGTTVDRVRKSN